MGLCGLGPAENIVPESEQAESLSVSAQMTPGECVSACVQGWVGDKGLRLGVSLFPLNYIRIRVQQFLYLPWPLLCKEIATTEATFHPVLEAGGGEGVDLQLILA